VTHQPSFAHAEFATKKKTTRREKFLARMETLLPSAQLLAVIEPFYPQGKRLAPNRNNPWSLKDSTRVARVREFLEKGRL
jgi:hypothetical protein